MIYEVKIKFLLNHLIIDLTIFNYFILKLPKFLTIIQIVALINLFFQVIHSKYHHFFIKPRINFISF